MRSPVVFGIRLTSFSLSGILEGQKGDILEEELLTTEEAAGFLKVNEKTVREWARAGRIPSYRILDSRTALRFKRSELEALLVPQQHKPSGRKP